MTETERGLAIGAALVVAAVWWSRRGGRVASTLDGTMATSTLAGEWRGGSSTSAAWARTCAMQNPPGGGRATGLRGDRW